MVRSFLTASIPLAVLSVVHTTQAVFIWNLADPSRARSVNHPHVPFNPLTTNLAAGSQISNTEPLRVTPSTNSSALSHNQFNATDANTYGDFHNKSATVEAEERLAKLVDALAKSAEEILEGLRLRGEDAIRDGKLWVQDNLGDDPFIVENIFETTDEEHRASRMRSSSSILTTTLPKTTTTSTTTRITTTATTTLATTQSVSSLATEESTTGLIISGMGRPLPETVPSRHRRRLRMLTADASLWFQSISEMISRISSITKDLQAQTESSDAPLKPIGVTVDDSNSLKSDGSTNLDEFSSEKGSGFAPVADSSSIQSGNANATSAFPEEVQKSMITMQRIFASLQSLRGVLENSQATGERGWVF